MVMAVLYQSDGKIVKIMMGSYKPSADPRRLGTGEGVTGATVYKCPAEIAEMDSREIMSRCRVKDAPASNMVELEIVR